MLFKKLLELVTIARSKEDRRAVEVELTFDGKKLVKRAPRVAQGLLVEGLERLTLNKLQEISSALEELVYILGAQELLPPIDRFT